MNKPSSNESAPRTFVKAEAIATMMPEGLPMIPPREILMHVFAEPFEPFRISTASGRTFEVRHPEFVQVGRSTLTVYTPPEDNPDGPHHWEKFSFMLIESLAPVNAPAPPQEAR